MPPHVVASGTISFGLVAIPIRLYTATSAQSVSFNLLHAKCGSRIKQQQSCPACAEPVERADLVRAYEVAKDQYVRVTDEELKALEGEASQVLDIVEFVPIAAVDPVYFEKTYYLGPDKGGAKPYRLLAEALATSGRVAVARFVMRGKESLVLIRAAQGGLVLHALYFADEVRAFSEVDRGEDAAITRAEHELAVKLIEGLARGRFEPELYRDAYRVRVLDLVQKKVEGQQVAAPAPPAAPRAQIINLMDALQASLARQPARATAKGKATKGARVAPARRGRAGGRVAATATA